jgi:MFS family permease
MTTRSKSTFVLWVLFGINLMNFFDRQILGAVGETIRNEWQLSDVALGILGTAFTLIYAAVGLPLGRLTDRITRTWILSAGVFVWSLFTAVSGVAQNYAQLFAVRLGVGVGEASCAPAASSLIGDLFPAAKRGKALSIFMLGLPLGVASSFAVSSWVTQRWGWRPSFYVAAIPGVICAVLALLVREPGRGAAEIHNVSQLRRQGKQNGSLYFFGLWILLGLFYYLYLRDSILLPLSELLMGYRVSVRSLDLCVWAAWGLLFILGVLRRRAVDRWMEPVSVVLSIPTMWWLILSGALHNFNMYAVGSFLSPFLQRVHHVDALQAGMISMVTYGLSGVPGLILGGIIGDSVMRRRPNGRLLVAAVAVLMAVPLVYFALGRPAGATVSFTAIMFIGWALMYVYYATVYSAIQDVIEPALRGTAMALYFFAMYVLGASLGPVGMGDLSRHYTIKAAQAAGVTETTFEALRPFAPQGLHSALFIVPVLGFLLAVVLFAGSRTVTKDMDRLQRWMREAADKTSTAGSARAEAAK